MTQQWNESYEIGHDHIDHHHQELFEWVSKLDQVVETHRRVSIDELISFFEHYVKDHFQEEETLMKSHQFDGYEYHKAEHEIFKVRVEALRKDYDQGTPNAHLIFTIRKFIDRLIDHIVTVDIQMAGLKDGPHQAS